MRAQELAADGSLELVAHGADDVRDVRIRELRGGRQAEEPPVQLGGRETWGGERRPSELLTRKRCSVNSTRVIQTLSVAFCAN